ncbi:MAG TPA: hypothetical protein VGK73_12545 [Polyangiaceae bacterium]
MTAARLLVVLLCLASLFGCRKQAGIATLLRTNGSVERDRASAVGTWSKGAPGDRFELGDGVRTGKVSTANLDLMGRGELAMEPKTLLRFLAGRSGAGKERLQIETGEATLTVGGGAVFELETDLGVARIESNSQVRLSRAGARARFEVMIGSAELLGPESPGAESPGSRERFLLSMGEAVEIEAAGKPRRVAALNPAPSAASPGATPSSAPAPSASAPALGAAPGASSSADAVSARPPPGPSVVDFTAAAGDSFTVHDPRPPTALGFSAGGQCANGLIATINPGGARSRQTSGGQVVSVELAAGSHRYVIACIGDEQRPIARGTIAVVHDAGSRKLPAAPPATTVDTDGRTYTVLYQNRLPKISVRWPAAPATGPFQLTARSPAGSRTHATNEPLYSFPSGALGEGQHEFTFAGGGQRSRSTTVVIRFDNAAPAASIASPADGSFSPGASVQVSGTALPGFVVSVAGQDLGQDEQNRFSAQVTAPGGDRALAIRFSLPGRGTHYYLRRSVR